MLATYSYDNLGRRTSLTRGNGVVTSYAYDSASRLAALTHNLAGTSHDQTYDFSYNAAFQALARDGSNAAYDWTPSAPGTTSYADNGLNQYTSVGGATHTYDGRGNLTGTGATTYGYDVYNRLTSAGSATHTSSSCRVSRQIGRLGPRPGFPCTFVLEAPSGSIHRHLARTA